jgi:predicted P-loop ATPase/GTPase
VKKFKIQLPLVVPDLVYTFQMICLRAAEVIERKPNAGHNAWNALYALQDKKK